LDWGTLIGTFSTLQLPSLTAPLSWNTSQLYTTGSLVVTAFVLGDINRDGRVDVADISAMLAALADVDGYQSTHGLNGCAVTDEQLLQIADLTADNNVTNADIQGLINLLAKAGDPGSLAAVPEPTSIVLLGLGALAIAFCHRFA